MADDSDSKTGTAFTMRHLHIRCRTLHAPCVETLGRWGFKFNFRRIQTGPGPVAVQMDRFDVVLAELRRRVDG